MFASRKGALLRLLVGGSTLAMAPGMAQAQAAQAPPVDQKQPTEEQRPATANTSAADAPPGQAGNDLVITGIRASLRQSRDIKKKAVGVVGAISAEDVG